LNALGDELESFIPNSPKKKRTLRILCEDNHNACKLDK